MGLFRKKISPNVVIRCCHFQATPHEWVYKEAGEHVVCPEKKKEPVSVTFSDGSTDPVFQWTCARTATETSGMAGRAALGGTLVNGTDGFRWGGVVMEKPMCAKLPPLPTPPVDEPWFSWDLWWKYYSDRCNDHRKYGPAMPEEWSKEAFSLWIRSKARDAAIAEKESNETVKAARAIQEKVSTKSQRN